MIEDLQMVKITYHDSMKKLGLMTSEELEKIFGPMSTLISLHEDLAEQLREQRLPDGTTDSIGEALLEWVSDQE